MAVQKDDWIWLKFSVQSRVQRTFLSCHWTGICMFWKFPESVKCARLRLAHLTNSGNFQNINTPAEPLPGHPAPEINAMIEWIISIRGGVQKRPFFLGDLSQMWVGRVADSQTRPNPLKITAKIAFFDPNFNLRFPKSRKNPWVGGWVNTFGKDSFFWTPSLIPQNVNLFPLYDDAAFNL